MISFKLGGAFDYRRSSWANVLWPLWGVAGFTGVLLSLLLCCGVPMVVRRHASGSGTHVQLMVLLVLVLLCATYLPAVVSAVRLAAWLDGEPDISAASILAPYLVACSIVLLTLVACLLTLAFTARLAAHDCGQRTRGRGGRGGQRRRSSFLHPAGAVCSRARVVDPLPPCVGRAARTIQAIAKGRRRGGARGGGGGGGRGGHDGADAAAAGGGGAASAGGTPLHGRGGGQASHGGGGGTGGAGDGTCGAESTGRGVASSGARRRREPDCPLLFLPLLFLPLLLLPLLLRRGGRRGHPRPPSSAHERRGRRCAVGRGTVA